MAETKLKGEPVELDGSFLREGDLAPDFVLVNQELENITLENFPDRKKLIATVPSLDTTVCLTEAKNLNVFAKKHPEIMFLIVSYDLPFAQKRACVQEDLHNVMTLSIMRKKSNFAKDYGVYIASGPLEGLCARSLVLLDEQDKVIYSELTEDITHPPNLDAAFAKLSS